MNKTNYHREKIDEVVFGHGYVQGGGLNSARIASQQAGFPETGPAYGVIKACGSSLKAITNSVASIQTGQCETIVVGGVESMSNIPYLVKNRWGSKFGNVEMEDALLTDGLICSLGREHMGVTAERLAEQYEITRDEQDDFAHYSQDRKSTRLNSSHVAISYA